MKRLSLRLLLVGTMMFCAATYVDAEWEFDSIGMSAGQDALASGITGSLRLIKDRQFIDLTVQHEQGWIVWGRKFKYRRLTTELGGSVGHSFGEPWIAPYLYGDISLGSIIGQSVTVSTVQWPFFLAQEPEPWRSDDKPNDEAVPWGLYSDISLNIGFLGVTVSRTDFLNDQLITCLGGSYTLNIRKDFSIKMVVTYNFRTGKMMYLIGGKWSHNSN